VKKREILESQYKSTFVLSQVGKVSEFGMNPQTGLDSRRHILMWSAMSWSDVLGVQHTLARAW
jgi:hypothetical protein